MSLRVRLGHRIEKPEGYCLNDAYRRTKPAGFGDCRLFGSESAMKFACHGVIELFFWQGDTYTLAQDARHGTLDILGADFDVE